MIYALQAATGAIVVGLLAALYRVLRGPTIWDQLSGVGVMLTKTIVLLLLVGKLSDRLTDYVDIALTYAMIAFIGTLALARYFEVRKAAE